MVSQPRGLPASSRDRLLAAAAAEFAARGFDGAKVDRMTAQARVNKAMLYYHFRNKAALYRHIVGAQFEALAAALAVPAPPEAVPEDRLRRFIRTVAAELTARPHFPAIWLREMAEGGRHLDRTIVDALGRIIAALAAILRDGQAAGVFRPAHPLVTQMGIVAPLLLFAASAPVRERFKHLAGAGIADVPHEAVLAHVEASTLAALQSGAKLTRSQLVVASPRRVRS